MRITNLRKIMRCIFCKKDSSDSKSIEHIIPESIGSRKRILPPGVVCDKCNNYFARKVEQPIMEHSWIRNLRAWFQVPNKKGNYPSLLGNIGGTDIHINLRKNPDGKLKLTSEKLSESKSLDEVMESGLNVPLLFKIEDNVPKREMSRFLCKMALEASAELYNGNHLALGKLIDEPFYDRIRNFARYGSGSTEWPFSQRTLYPFDTLMRHPDTNEWATVGFGFSLFMTKRYETFFAFGLHGVEFVVNVGGPSIKGYEEWLKDHSEISPLVERMGCSLRSERHGNTTKYYLDGTFDQSKGFDFDKRHGYFGKVDIEE